MGKYHISKAKKLKFARFGGLSSVNQKGYDSSMPGFHSPPASRGFYCFVWPFYEMFLLGGADTCLPYNPGAKFSYANGSDGKRLDDKHPEYAKFSEKESGNRYWSTATKEWAAWQKQWPDYSDPDYDKKMESLDAEWNEKFGHLAKWVYTEKPRPRIFEYDGEIWHHIVAPVPQVDILATKGAWVKTTTENYRAALEKEIHSAQKGAMEWVSKIKNYPVLINGKLAMRFQSKDHLECFIEKL